MDLQFRKTCRAKVTRLIKEAEDLLKAEIAVEELSVMLDRLTVANNNLKEANEKALPHVKEEKYEEEFEQILEYDDRVTIATSRLKQRVSSQAQAEEQGSRQNAASVEGNQHRGDSCQRQQQAVPYQEQGAGISGGTDAVFNTVRLPKLNLKIFNGDLHDFIPFWEQFKSAVHENRFLDGAAKFNYLKSVLTGRALETINGLTPSEACYNDAIEMIKNEFGNKERIVDSYIQQLINLNPVKGKHDVTGLRKLYNTTSAVTRSLKVLGISADNYGLMVKTILIKSLPFQLKVEFNKLSEFDSDAEECSSQERADTSSTIKCEKQIELLLKFIKREVDSVESAQAISGTASTSSGVSREERNSIGRNKNDKSNNPRTVSGLFTSATDNKYVFCDNNTHNTFNCRNKSLTIE